MSHLDYRGYFLRGRDAAISTCLKVIRGESTKDIPEKHITALKKALAERECENCKQLGVAYGGALRENATLRLALADLMKFYEKLERCESSWSHVEGARMAEIHVLLGMPETLSDNILSRLYSGDELARLKRETEAVEFGGGNPPVLHLRKEAAK
jgi:hypothetical protein